MYQGEYNDKNYHQPDLSAVLDRAFAVGVDKLIITAGSLAESRAALELARTDPRLYSTVGVHPTRCGEFDTYPDGPEAYIAALHDVLIDGIKDAKVVAVGECGIDYDRLHFCDADTQNKYFEAQLKLAKTSNLPCFFHLRGGEGIAANDFMDIIARNNDNFTAGVVHSFDGTSEDLNRVLKNPKLSIGINGCSLKTQDNLEVVATIPIDRLLIETDCPWCDIRPTHAGFKYLEDLPKVLEVKDKKKHDEECGVKGRNEPCNIVQVLHVVAGARGLSTKEDISALGKQIYDNTERMFFPS